MPKTKSNLTAKQRLFADEFVICRNATEAARRAGYSGSDATLAVIGYENLRKPKIKDQIERAFNERTMSAGEVLIRLTEIARGGLSDYLDLSVPGLPIFDFEKAERANRLGLLKKYKVTKAGIEIELHDVLRALDLLTKYHNLTNTINLEDWRSKAIEDIKAGQITYQALAEAFDPDLATTLFREAGISVSS